MPPAYSGLGKLVRLDILPEVRAEAIISFILELESLTG
jgi:hypothetical protein